MHHRTIATPSQLGPSPRYAPSRAAIPCASMPGRTHASLLNFSMSEAGPSCPSGDSPVLFAHVLCPYAERAWLALLEKEVPFQLFNIDLSNKPPWFRGVNPRGLVSAVRYQGQVQVESLDICGWVDATFDGPALTPPDAPGVKAMQQVITAGSALSNAGLDLLAGGNARHWGIGSRQSRAQRDAFEHQLWAAIGKPVSESGGPYLMGQRFTLADVAIFPFMHRFAVAMPAFAGYDVAAAHGGAIGQWLTAIRQRPAAAATAADEALLLAAFQRHKSLDFFDYDPYTAVALHPHNVEYMQ